MGEWRKFHNEEIHSLYRSPNRVRVIKFRRLRWGSNVANMGRGVVSTIRKLIVPFTYSQGDEI